MDALQYDRAGRDTHGGRVGAPPNFREIQGGGGSGSLA
jgi:hypothetical protein